MSNIIGYDISKWQGIVNFGLMEDTADFVIIKAGQGDWKDSRFVENWRNAKGILPRGSYWYYDNRYSPKSQARVYADTLRADPEGVCWLDLEDKTAGMYAGWKNWYEFITEFEYLTNSPVGIYTGYYYWIEMMSRASTYEKQWFGRYPLWLASYTKDPFKPDHAAIKVPYPWTSYTILQSGTPAIGHIAGVESLEIDYNIFMGNEDQFKAFFKPVTQQEQEPSMSRYEATSIYSMSLRPDHNTSNAPLTSIPAQSKMQGDEIWTSGTLEKWLKVVSVNGQPVKNAAGTVIPFGWVAIVAAGRIYCSLNEVTPPPVEELPSRFALSVDGVTWKWYVAE